MMCIGMKWIYYCIFLVLTSIITCDSIGYIITTQGTYEEDAPEAIESVETTTAAGSTSKFFHNGQILIRRGEKVYTLQGQEVRE